MFYYRGMEKITTTKELHEAFTSVAEREAFYVEQAKHSIISDFHRLAARIGREEALKFLEEEITSLPF